MFISYSAPMTLTEYCNLRENMFVHVDLSFFFKHYLAEYHIYFRIHVYEFFHYRYLDANNIDDIESLSGDVISEIGRLRKLTKLYENVLFAKV